MLDRPRSPIAVIKQSTATAALLRSPAVAVGKLSRLTSFTVEVGLNEILEGVKPEILQHGVTMLTTAPTNKLLLPVIVFAVTVKAIAVFYHQMLRAGSWIRDGIVRRIP